MAIEGNAFAGYGIGIEGAKGNTMFVRLKNMKSNQVGIQFRLVLSGVYFFCYCVSFFILFTPMGL